MQKPFFCCSALTPRSQLSIDELNVSAEGFLKNRSDRSLAQKIEGLKVKIRELAQHHFTLDQFIHATDRSTPLPEEEAIIKKYTLQHPTQANDSTLSKQVVRTILNALHSSKNAFELQKSQYEAVLRIKNNPVHFPARPPESSSPSTSFALQPTGRSSHKLELPSVDLSPAAQHLIEEPMAPQQSSFTPLPGLAHSSGKSPSLPLPQSDTKSPPPTRQSVTLMPIHHHSMLRASSVPHQTEPPQVSTSSPLNNSLPTRHAFTPPPSTTTQSPTPPRNFHTPPPVFSHVSSQKRYSSLERQTQEHIHTHSSLNACQSSPSFLPSIARDSTQVASHPVQPTSSQQPSLDTRLLSTIEKIKLVYIHYKNKISQCESQETKETLAKMFSDKIFSFILAKNFSKVQFGQLLQFLTTLPPLPPKEARDTKEDD